MKIIPFDQVDPNLWNQFVDESPEAWLYHRTEWTELEETQGYQNESFTILSDKGQPLGIFCVYLSDRGPWWRLWDRHLHTGHCRSGPAFLRGLSEKERKEVMSFALGYLEDLARRAKVNRLEIRLPSLAPTSLPPLRSEINPLWEYGFVPFPMYGTSGIARLQKAITLTSIVHLQGSDEEHLFKDLSDPSQRAVRKAAGAGVTCLQGNGMAGLKAFYTTYQASYLRSGSAMRPFAFFQEMYERLSEKGWMKTFLAFYEEKPIASVLLLCYKDAVTYYAGGVDYTAQQLRPHNLLFWETLRWAKQGGWKWYEIGPYFPYLPKEDKMSRIGHFKRQFGGSSFPLFEGAFFYNWPLYLGGALVEEAVLRIPSPLRQWVLSIKGRKK